MEDTLRLPTRACARCKGTFQALMILNRVQIMPQVLKQKRLYENQRDQLYNQQFNVEQTSFMMENVQDSVQTVQAMKAAGERGLRDPSCTLAACAAPGQLTNRLQ